MHAHAYHHISSTKSFRLFRELKEEKLTVFEVASNSFAAFQSLLFFSAKLVLYDSRFDVWFFYSVSLCRVLDYLNNFIIVFLKKHRAETDVCVSILLLNDLNRLQG